MCHRKHTTLSDPNSTLLSHVEPLWCVGAMTPAIDRDTCQARVDCIMNGDGQHECQIQNDPFCGSEYLWLNNDTEKQWVKYWDPSARGICNQGMQPRNQRNQNRRRNQRSQQCNQKPTEPAEHCQHTQQREQNQQTEASVANNRAIGSNGGASVASSATRAGRPSRVNKAIRTNRDSKLSQES